MPLWQGFSHKETIGDNHNNNNNNNHYNNWPYLSVNLFSALALIGDTLQARIGIWKCWLLKRGENWSTQRKPSQSRDENQQQTQSTYDARSGNRTRDTLVGGEHYILFKATCSA